MSTLFFDVIPEEINLLIIEYVDIIREYLPLGEIFKPLLRSSPNLYDAFIKYNKLINKGLVNHFKSVSYYDYAYNQNHISNLYYKFINIFKSKKCTIQDNGIVVGDRDLGCTMGKIAASALINKYSDENIDAIGDQFIYAVFDQNHYYDMDTDYIRSNTLIFRFKDKYYKLIFYHFFDRLEKKYWEYDDWENLLKSIKNTKIWAKMFYINGYINKW